jgi:hypothetical protein
MSVKILREDLKESQNSKVVESVRALEGVRGAENHGNDKYRYRRFEGSHKTSGLLKV